MLQVDNRTGLAARLFPWIDASGVEHAIVVAKASYVLARGALRPTDEPAELLLADEHHGPPETSSVRRESDVAPGKPGTDVVVIGSARAPLRVPELLLQIEAGRARHAVRVVGDRVWVRGAVGYQPSEPVRFDTMPLVWERAFGGTDPAPDPGGPLFDRRNPLGVGFVSPRARVEHLPLPNLEDPRAPLRAPGERPTPTAPGVVGRSWAPRAQLGGTFDDAWRQERAPLLPLDFDLRFFQCAPAALVTPTHLEGGERLFVSHALAGGVPFEAAVPTLRLVASVKLFGQRTQHPLALDTVVIDTDAASVSLTLRALVRCPKAFLAIEHVRIDHLGSTEGRAA